jgi:hypothetical protein
MAHTVYKLKACGIVTKNSNQLSCGVKLKINGVTAGATDKGNTKLE